jgi:flagellar export protein FliJ
MRRFTFRLEKVLAWRRSESELEEYRLKQLSQALDQTERTRAHIVTERATSEFSVVRSNAITGAELHAHAAYAQALARREQELERQRAEQARLVAEQHQKLAEARRRLKLLERLRERALTQWKVSADREIEELAAESHIAHWNATER